MQGGFASSTDPLDSGRFMAAFPRQVFPSVTIRSLLPRYCYRCYKESITHRKEEYRKTFDWVASPIAASPRPLRRLQSRHVE